MSRSVLLIGLLGTILLVSCKKDTITVPDVSHIEVDFNTYRFDRALAAVDTTDIEEGIDSLAASYGDFYRQYFELIVPLRDDSLVSFAESFRGFLSAPSVRYLLDTTGQIYPEEVWSEIESEFTSAFQLYKYYFPQAEIPDIYTIVSEYSLQRFVTVVDSSEAIGIGLDMYLGRNFPYQLYNPQNPAFSQYLTRRFDRDHMVKRSMEQLIEEQLGYAIGERLLDIMIHNGKKLYLLDKVLPYTPDSIIMEYTTDQYEWVSKNELEMWAFLFKEDLFYKTNRLDINKYINEAPHSPGMPPEAPGRTANYIGWQIVEKFMERYPETTIDELVDMRDAQVLLDKSRYKPRT